MNSGCISHEEDFNFEPIFEAFCKQGFLFTIENHSRALLKLKLIRCHRLIKFSQFEA